MIYKRLNMKPFKWFSSLWNLKRTSCCCCGVFLLFRFLVEAPGEKSTQRNCSRETSGTLLICSGTRGGLRCVCFLHQQSSSGVQSDWDGNRVYIFVYIYSVTSTPPTTAGVKKTQSIIITTVREVPDVTLHSSGQFADTYLILKTSFCASFSFSTRFEINICKANKKF